MDDISLINDRTPSKPVLFIIKLNFTSEKTLSGAIPSSSRATFAKNADAHPFLRAMDHPILYPAERHQEVK